MKNQEQFSEDPMPVEAAAESEFSYTRRVATAVLVLLAAGLLGYVLYFYLVMPMVSPTNDVEQDIGYNESELMLEHLQFLQRTPEDRASYQADPESLQRPEEPGLSDEELGDRRAYLESLQRN